MKMILSGCAVPAYRPLLLLISSCMLLETTKAACADLTSNVTLGQCGAVNMGTTTLSALATGSDCDKVSRFDAWIVCIGEEAKASADVNGDTDTAGICIQSLACDNACPIQNPFGASVWNCPPTAAPTKAPTAPPPSNPACFSATAKVFVQGQYEPISMRELAVGDRVLTYGQNQKALAYEKVYAFVHRNPSSRTSFLSISIQNEDGDEGNALEVTSDHLIYVHGKTHPVVASSIQTGDLLVTASLSSEQNTTIGVVSSVKAGTVKGGLYAPLTPSGTMLVDGLLVSNYIGLDDYVTLPFLSDHSVVHMWMSPFRILCHHGEFKLAYCHKYNQEGILHWLTIAMDLSDWATKQASPIRAVAITVAFVVLHALYVVEILLLAVMAMHSFSTYFAFAVCALGLFMLKMKFPFDEPTKVKAE